MTNLKEDIDKPKNHLFVPVMHFVLYAEEIMIDNFKIMIKA